MILKATPNLAKPFNCTATGVKWCGAKCCTKLGSYWPIRVYPMGCPYLSNTGCRLSVSDRPIDCLLYPLFINKNGTLVVHNHCYHRTWMCHPNVGVGAPLVDSIGEMLAELFGPVTLTGIRTKVMEGKECHFETTPEFDLHREVEQICMKYDHPIIPRTEITRQTLDILRAFVVGMPVSKHYHEV